MPKRGKAADPFAAREAARYDNPIPSREFIIQQLEAANRPLDNTQIAELLQLSEPEQIDALRNRLRAMQRDGQLLIDRRGAYGVVDRMNLLRCRVQGHRDGYGFAVPIAGGEDVYLSARQMRQLFDGDTVLVAVSGIDRRGRAEGKVVEVLERGVEQVVGRYQEESGIGFVLPDNARINQQVLIPPKCRGKARSGQIVTARITHYPSGALGAKGEIVEVLGDHLDPGLEIEVAIRAHGIPWQWPDAVLDEAGQLREEPLEADKRHRIDLRALPFVTIDGEDARDFDDAVYCRKKRLGGWKLYVAIADVSHYVQPGSALDTEATHRGNSVYFPERVVPMLPEVLSNGLCSLKPKVDRLALVAEMDLGRDGSLKSFCFYEAVIHSAARLTYTQVGRVLENGSDPEVDAARVPDLQRLHTLYKLLRERREQRGAIDFDTVETRIVFNEQRKIDAIVPVVRNDAHKLIEECMLCANVAAAEFFTRLKLPALFRVHEGPSAEKLENLRAFLGELGLGLGGGARPAPTDYQILMQQMAGRDDAHIIQTMLLRSLSQAVYQVENKGHFGLNYQGYTHFTSPIRRYPDLLVHRGIRSVIRSKRRTRLVRRADGARPLAQEQIYPYEVQSLTALGERCSLTERRADDATRDVQAWLKCEYLQEHVGDEFNGTISAVTSFGLFVELEDLYIEGLVHVTALPGDYYRFDPAHQRLLGERSGRSFQLGGRVRVQVVRVDLDDKKIDLEPVALPGSRKQRGAGKDPVPVRGDSGEKPAKSNKSRRGKAGPAKGVEQESAAAEAEQPAVRSKSARRRASRKAAAAREAEQAVQSAGGAAKRPAKPAVEAAGADEAAPKAQRSRSRRRR